MKRNIRYLTVPLHIWEHGDLTLQEKHVLIDIDSLCSSEGIAIGPQSLATMSGIPVKEIKEILASLYQKGALEINLDENGAKILKPLMWKERYVRQEEKVIIGDSPKDVEQIDWDEIQTKWTEYCPTLPPITRWTPARKAKVRSVLKNAALTISDLYKCFRIIAVTPFLSGESNQFKATFDWVTAKSHNLSKIYEGFYSKSFAEKQAYDEIMNGNAAPKSDSQDDYYR